MSDVDLPVHFKPLSEYSHMVCSKQQCNVIGPVCNIQVQISNQKERAQKRRLDDSCFDETLETPLKRPCVVTTCSPDQGCFSFDFQGSTPLQKLVITKNFTPPRSKVNQPVTPVISTPLSKCVKNQIYQDWESLPSPIPALKWDREVSSVEISLHRSLNLDGWSSVPLVGSKGTVIPNHESKSPPETVFPLKEEEVVSVSQQAQLEVTRGNGESTAESFESTLPLQVQVKSKVVVPDNTKSSSKPVMCCSEEDWERNKRTYVESVKRHMTEQNGVITELHSLMNSVANLKPGRNGRHWQHPSDLTRRNYKLWHVKGLSISLEEWQKRNHLTHRRFAKVPDFFYRSPVL